MEYKTIIGKFFSLIDILFASIAILLQKNVRTFKEGSDLATFVVVMTYFTLKIIFFLMEENRKSKREQQEQELFEEYREDIQEFIKNRKKDEIEQITNI